MSAPIILVGVTTWQPESVATTAVSLAGRVEGTVLFVSIDASRLQVETQADGRVVAQSIDSDVGDVIVEEFNAQLKARLEEIAAHHNVPCRFLAAAGNPGRVLGDVANTVDAFMIVVGTRRPTFGATLREFFSGSVAATLSHRQHRPVLVVPVAPVGGDAPLPWDGEKS